MKNFVLLLLISFLAPLQAYSGNVLQVRGKHLLFEPGSLKQGEAISVLGSDGKSKGEGIVKQVGKTKSLGELSSGSASVGDKVDTKSAEAPSLNDPFKTESTPKAEPTEKKWVFAVGLTYSLASSAKLSGTYSFSSVSLPISTVGNTGTGFGIIGEGQYWFGKSFGLRTSLEYQLERKVDNGLKYSLNGSPVTIVTDDKYANLMFMFDGVYQMGALYIPGGINYSLVRYASTGSVQATGTLGYQVGIGYMLFGKLGTEVTYRITNFKLKIQNPTYSVDYPSGAISEIILIGKWHF